MSHPDFDRLSGYVYELDESPRVVEEHLSGCAPCALQTLRLQRERSLLERALDVPMPVRGRRPWVYAAAAAVIISLVSAAAIHQARRADDLQREVAALKGAPEPSLHDLCQGDIDRSVMEMVAHAGLADGARASLRDALQFASVVPTDVLHRYLRGDVSNDDLARTDLLAPLERDFRARLSPDEYERVSDYLEKSRTAAAGALAARTGEEMDREVGLSAEQRVKIETLVREKSAWRLDIALLPEALAGIVGLSTVSSGEMHDGIVALLVESQRGKFESYLKRQHESLRRKYS